MNKMQKQVEEFHRTFDLGVGTRPGIPDVQAKARRFALISEELDELHDAMWNNNIVETADALGDLLYVVLGSAVEFGIDMEPVFEEIHRSNMTKVGGHKNEYGKFVKPDTYEPANLGPIIEQQTYDARVREYLSVRDQDIEEVARQLMEKFEFQHRHGE